MRRRLRSLLADSDGRDEGGDKEMRKERMKKKDEGKAKEPLGGQHDEEERRMIRKAEKVSSRKRRTEMKEARGSLLSERKDEEEEKDEEREKDEKKG